MKNGRKKGGRGSQRRKDRSRKQKRCNEGMKRRMEQGLRSTSRSPGYSQDAVTGVSYRNMDPNRVNMSMIDRNFDAAKQGKGISTNGIPEGRVGLDTTLIFHLNTYVQGKATYDWRLERMVAGPGHSEEQLAIIHDRNVRKSSYTDLAMQQKWVTVKNLKGELGLPEGIEGMLYNVKTHPEEARNLLVAQVGRAEEIAMDVHSPQAAEIIQSHFVEVEVPEGKVYAFMFHEGFPAPDRVYIIHNSGFTESMLPDYLKSVCSSRISPIPVRDDISVSGFHGRNIERATYRAAETLGVPCEYLFHIGNVEELAEKIMDR